ncbi:MAG: hypothetical protein MJA30_30270, partial [Cytophagales bacterium]|nr:hypothetical protein [Cytophagales bacterium]
SVFLCALWQLDDISCHAMFTTTSGLIYADITKIAKITAYCSKRFSPSDLEELNNGFVIVHLWIFRLSGVVAG